MCLCSAAGRRAPAVSELDSMACRIGRGHSLCVVGCAHAHGHGPIESTVESPVRNREVLFVAITSTRRVQAIVGKDATYLYLLIRLDHYGRTRI